MVVVIASVLIAFAVMKSVRSITVRSDLKTEGWTTPRSVKIRNGEREKVALPVHLKRVFERIPSGNQKNLAAASVVDEATKNSSRKNVEAVAAGFVATAQHLLSSHAG